MRYFDNYLELDKLGVKHNTNKASTCVHNELGKIERLSLLQRYEFFLNPLIAKRSPFSMLELGAGVEPDIGASIKMWRDFLPSSSSIVVADIKPGVAEVMKGVADVVIGDLTYPDPHKICESHGPYDFILDDASHFWQHQINSFRWLWGSLNSGGLFIVEDVHVCFQNYRDKFSLGMDQKDSVSFFGALARARSRFRDPNSRNEGQWNDFDKALIREIYHLTDKDFEIVKTIDFIAFLGQSIAIVKM